MKEGQVSVSGDKNTSKPLKNFWNYSYSFKSMTNVRNKIQNTLAHLFIDGLIHNLFYKTAHLLALLQTITVITPKETDLYRLLYWSEPSNYLPSSLCVILGTIFIVIFLLLLMLRLYFVQKGETLARPSLFLSYIGTLTLYIQLLCKTIVLIPFIRGVFLQFQNPTNSIILSLSIIGLILYVVIIYPIFLHVSSTTLILTSQVNRKIQVFNAELILNIFRGLFAATTTFGYNTMLAFQALFALLFLLAIAKTPIFSYKYEGFKKIVASAVAYICLETFFSSVFSIKEDSVVISILGIAGFTALIQWICILRIKSILTRKEPSVGQIKLLIFMVCHQDCSLDSLVLFVIKHSRNCQHLGCSCKQIISSLTSTEGSVSDSLWYQFLKSYIQNYLNLSMLKSLPESELLKSIKKYSYLIFDLAQIILFKLQRPNQSYLLISNYFQFLKQHKLEELWDRLKFKIIAYFIEQKIKIKLKDQTNVEAEKYMSFQVDINRYWKQLIATAEKSQQFWEQLSAQEPSQSELLGNIQLLDTKNQQIQESYRYICSRYEGSKHLLEAITNDYYQKVLNIAPKESFHLIEEKFGEQQFHEKSQKVQSLSEIVNSFSYSSETPLFFVSVESHSFGKITKCNTFFQQMLMKLGKSPCLESLIIPQMRNYHLEAMKRLVNNQSTVYQHKDGFILNDKMKLIHTKLLVQAVPSLSEGLLFAVFLKKFNPLRKVLVTRDGRQIAYTSESLDRLFDSNQSKLRLTEAISAKCGLLQNHGDTIEFSLMYHTFSARLLYSFNDGKNQLMFLQMEDQNPSESGESEEHSQQQEIVHRPSAFARSGQSCRQSTFHSLAKPGKSSAFRQLAEKTRSRSQLKKKSDLKINSYDFKFGEQSQYVEPTIEKQKKMERKLKNGFEVILQQSKGSQILFMFRMVLIIGSVILTSAYIGCIVIKNNHQKVYSDIFSNNLKFFNMMSLIGSTGVNLKLLNLYQQLGNNSFSIYQSLLDTPNIKREMDSALSYFYIPDISTEWPTLRIDYNKAISEGSQKFYMTVADYLQTPLQNLKESSQSSFNFSLVLDSIPTPLTAVQIHYNNFLLNSLYIAIPNFFRLKKQLMSPIQRSQFNKSSGITIASSIIIITCFLMILLITLANRRLDKLRNYTRKFIQLLNLDLIQQKKQECRLFLKKYKVCPKEEKEERTLTAELTEIQKGDQPDGVGRSLSESTEKEIQIQNLNGGFDIDTISLANKFRGKTEEKSAVKRRKQFVFREVTLSWVIVRRLIAVSIIYIFAIFFIVWEGMQRRKLNSILKAMNDTQLIQINVILIHLYALHYGVYSPMLDKYLQIPKYLTNLVYCMFEDVFNQIKTITSEISDAFSNFQYGNLCRLDQEGTFAASTHKFAQRYNQTYCASLSDSILTKGFSSTILAYLQSANTLLTIHPNTLSYSISQRIEYFKSSFFTEGTKLIDYMTVVLEAQSVAIKESYMQTIEAYRSRVVILSLAFMVVGILFAIVSALHSNFSIQRQIGEVRSIFRLISHQTVRENEQLKTRFLQNLDQIKQMR